MPWAGAMGGSCPQHMDIGYSRCLWNELSAETSNLIVMVSEDAHQDKRKAGMKDISCCRCFGEEGGSLAAVGLGNAA